MKNNDSSIIAKWTGKCL